MTKIAAKKSKFGGFFGCDFCHPITDTLPSPPPSIAIIAGPLMGNENLTEKIENISGFIWCDFRCPTTHTLPAPSQSTQNPPWVMKIALKKSKTSVDFFGLIFVTQLPTHTLSLPPLHRRTSLGDKNCAEKIENVGLIFFAAILSPYLPLL